MGEAVWSASASAALWLFRFCLGRKDGAALPLSAAAREASQTTKAPLKRTHSKPLPVRAHS
jgi:hypothetical protein